MADADSVDLGPSEGVTCPSVFEFGVRRGRRQSPVCHGAVGRKEYKVKHMLAFAASLAALLIPFPAAVHAAGGLDLDNFELDDKPKKKAVEAASEEPGAAVGMAPQRLTPDKDWTVPVKGHVPVAPGEHPRLIFRKTDVPELRKRAETPEGKTIMARLKELLDGPITARHLAEGAAQGPEANKELAFFQRQSDGPFTLWHAAGWAFLYQMTGDARHAARAAAMAKRAVSGEANVDGRYTWPGNGQLRAGPALSAIALAYDMAYDGWDAATRKSVADAITANPCLKDIASRPRHCPGCNHWGAHTGGAGIAALALRGDPEVNAAAIEDMLTNLVFNAKREIFEGYGSRGYYYEGHHCGRLSSNTGLIPFIQAYRVAAGEDLVANSPNAQWLLTKWVYELVDHPVDARPVGFTYNSRGMYRREFGRSQSSEGGDFAQGFGICPEAHKPAVLWLYNRIVEPGRKTFDVTGTYPHLAAYSLANWPFGMQERNPGEIFGRVLYDEGPGYFVFRNGWKETGNVVVTVLLGNLPAGGRGMAAAGQVEVSGLGVKRRLPGIFAHCRPTMIAYDERTGMGVVSAKPRDTLPSSGAARSVKPPTDGITSVAVDCSGVSGAEALVVMTGPLSTYYTGYWLNIAESEVDGGGQTPQSRVTGAACATETTEAGGRTFQVSMLYKGSAPDIAVDGSSIVIGKQRISCEGDDIKLATLQPTFTWTPGRK
jgi:hypothetical protein